MTHSDFVDTAVFGKGMKHEDTSLINGRLYECGATSFNTSLFWYRSTPFVSFVKYPILPS